MNKRLKLFESKDFIVIAYDLVDAKMKSRHLQGDLEIVARDENITVGSVTLSANQWVDRLGRGIYHF